jgi:hypothetical protein
VVFQVRNVEEGYMQLIGFILGVVSLIGWGIALIPFLGWLNWLFIPVAVVGLIFSTIGIIRPLFGRGLGIAGIVLCLIVIVLGAMRLNIGCGII